MATRTQRSSVAAGASWSPRLATEKIRTMAKQRKLSLVYKIHAVQREGERELYVPDVLYVLRHGFVHNVGVPATRPPFYKYVIEGITPNSGGRSIGLVVIPDERNCIIKVVTIMWIDETSTRSGSILEGEE